jgi:RNA polymerase sigma-70 factor (ECF subfamily)
LLRSRAATENVMVPVNASPPRPQLRVVKSAPDDGALIEAIATGDESRAVELYDRLRPVVSRTVRRLAPRTLEHDDLVQLAFVELVVSLRSRPQIHALDAWACTITARTVFQRMRRARLEARFAVVTDQDVDVLLEEVCDAVDSPMLTSARRLALRQIAGILARLNQNRVQVFLLHDVHGFELKEIAEILGITTANAQSHLVRGRGDVHEALEHHADLRSLLSGEDTP